MNRHRSQLVNVLIFWQHFDSLNDREADKFELGSFLSRKKGNSVKPALAARSMMSEYCC
jgi:hypothetical protein